MLKNLFVSILVAILSFQVFATEPRHGVAMHGDTKYPPDFKHFEYTNPEAPKGGTLRLGVIGDNFDSFNPFLIKGVAPRGTNYLYQTLTESAEDEAFSQYGLIAERIEMPKDRSWVTFYIDKNAKFSDGHPILAEDVKYSFDMLTGHKQATPFYSAYYADVESVEIRDDHTIHFAFKTDQNKELPLILGQMPVLAKHYWEKHDFGTGNMNVPVGNGPYTLTDFDPGRSVTYERNPDYWAKNHPVNKGRYNFDKIVFEYYKDNTIALEAFKAGEYDFRVERTARNWANAYEGGKFETGELIKEEVEHGRPAGMQAFVMNTRRELFKDPLVRRALAYAFDFEWTNQNLFNGQYKRTDSYFENSELASSGLPSEAELAILEPYKDKLPPEVFNEAFEVPSTQPPGSLRKNLRAGLRLLKQAGWSVKNNQLTNDKTGKTFQFEFLLFQKDFERVVQPFLKNLEKLGIQASIRVVDTTQYINRMRSFDFDLAVASMGQSDSPGNEQREYWHSEKAEQPGSRNYAGIQDPVVDALIEQVISAPDRKALVDRTRALDRVLLWGHYVVPNWYNPVDRIAYSNTLARPEITPKTGVSTDTWWVKARP